MNKKTKIFISLVVLIVALSEAQVTTPFKERFSQSLGGNMTMIANNMISRDATQPYNGNGDNQGVNMNTPSPAPGIFVDIDNDFATFNSSSANFKNPEVTEPCIAVLRAFLYWTGANSESINGWDFNEVKLKLPGDANYTTVEADDIIYDDNANGNEEFSNRPYVCVKDISEDVLKLGQDIYGTYQVANVEAERTASQGNSAGPAAGWQIVFIYRSPELPTKNITLFDGYAHIQGTRNNPAQVDVDFSGFVTVPNGPVSGDVLFGALEGDRGIDGDNLLIQNVAGDFVDLVAPLRPNDNFFNSRITVGNTDFLDRTPASSNTLGFDAGVFELNNPNNEIIANNSTATTLRITSGGDVYGLYALGLSVDVRQPNLYLTITRTTISDPVDPGTIVGVEFNVINTGFDAAVNVSFNSQLPDQVTLANPPVLPAGITYQYDETTNILEFNAEDGVFDLGNALSTIKIELQVKDECYFIEENGDLEIKLKFETLYNGTVNPDDPKIASSSIDPNTCLESPFIINVIKPELAWLTTTGNLDRVLDCGDALGLEEAQNLAPILNKCDPLQIPLKKISGVLIPNSSCADAGTYINTWTYVTPTGRVSEYVQKIIVDDVLGAENNELKDFEYSIHSNKIMTLSSQDVFKGFTVFNLLGQETFAKTLHSNKEQINLSGMNTGVYIILVKGQNETQKVIKIILK